MDEYFHELFETFIVGTTESTGASAQQLRVNDFLVGFK
jgi:hypothetical protein